MGQIMKKLQIKNENSFLFIDFPTGESELMTQVSAIYNSKPRKSHDFIMIFAENMNDAEKEIEKNMKLLTENGLLWFCYPKQSSKKYKSDISRDKTWSLFEKYNFRPVRQISLTDDWSAIRFRNKDLVGK